MSLRYCPLQGLWIIAFGMEASDQTVSCTWSMRLYGRRSREMTRRMVEICPCLRFESTNQGSGLCQGPYLGPGGGRSRMSEVPSYGQGCRVRDYARPSGIGRAAEQRNDPPHRRGAHKKHPPPRTLQ